MDAPHTPPQKTVLVVEDNEWCRKLLEVHLEMHGYASLAATRAETALQIAQQQEPDLILMDIQLPDVSGVEAIRTLKGDARTKTIPIIAVTAFALPSEKANTPDRRASSLEERRRVGSWRR
jgi:two-component system, cell cycle response regulator DivK